VFEEVKDVQLFFAQGFELSIDLAGDLFDDLLLKNFEHRSTQVAFEDRWVDVAFAADRRRVAEALGDGFDCGYDILFGLRIGVGGFEFAQQATGKDGASPGAEVLGGKVLLGDLTEIFVNVGSVDGVAIAVVVEILEELVAGKVAALLNDACEAAILKIDGVFDPLLPWKLKVTVELLTVTCLLRSVVRP
jgi:hypothetical protein